MTIEVRWTASARDGLKINLNIAGVLYYAYEALELKTEAGFPFSLDKALPSSSLEAKYG